MKPHLPDLLFKVLPRVLAFSEDDAFRWENDPQDYIRTTYDPQSDLIISTSMSIHFVFALSMLSPTGLSLTLFLRSDSCCHVILD